MTRAIVGMEETSGSWIQLKLPENVVMDPILRVNQGLW